MFSDLGRSHVYAFLPPKGQKWGVFGVVTPHQTPPVNHFEEMHWVLGHS